MGISDWSSDVCSSDLAIHFNGWYTARFELDGSGAERLWLTRDAIERLSIPFGFPFEALGNAVVWADVLQPLHAHVGDAQRKARGCARHVNRGRSEEHTSELQSLMRISYAVFCLTKKRTKQEYSPRTAVI